MMAGAPRPAWLLLLPMHLGDAICAALMVERCREGDSRPDAIDIVTAGPLRALLGSLAGVRRACTYAEAADRFLGCYDWVIDLGNTPTATELAGRLRFNRLIDRDPADRSAIRVRDGRLRLLDRFRSPTFDPRGAGRSGDPDLPIWALHAPLVAYAMNGSASGWIGHILPASLAFQGVEQRTRVGAVPPMAPRVALVPCASLTAKLWPEREWLALAEAGFAQGWSMTLVLGPSERGANLALRARFGERMLDSVRLPELAQALMDQDLVIANDCGPMHLAAALGRPVLALFGPTNPAQWFFYRKPGQHAFQAPALRDPWGMITAPDEPWAEWPEAATIAAAACRVLAAQP